MNLWLVIVGGVPGDRRGAGCDRTAGAAASERRTSDGTEERVQGLRAVVETVSP
jgi:hypothetical protein